MGPDSQAACQFAIRCAVGCDRPEVVQHALSPRHTTWQTSVTNLLANAGQVAPGERAAASCETESQPWQGEAIGSSTRITAENRFPNWCGGARTRDCAATPRSTTPDGIADSRFGSAASSAMSTRTRNLRSPVRTGRQPTGRRHARSTWSVCVIRPSTCVGYGIAGMRNIGGSPSLPTAARSTNSRSFPQDNSSVHRKTLSKYQRTCTCSEWPSVERDVEMATWLQLAKNSIKHMLELAHSGGEHGRSKSFIQRARNPEPTLT